jgi:transcriptional regulator with XRE-family HTH domain
MSSASLITDMRTRRGVTQADLARRSGIPRTAINAYEGGHRVPTAATLIRLAEACGLQLRATARPELDLQRNDQTLQMALDFAELLPSRRRGALTFPGLPT